MRHRRSYIVFAVAFVIHTLFSMTAHGAELAGAVYTPDVAEDEVIWHARWILADAEPTVLRFAVPLPAGEELLPSRGVEAIVENGRIAGVRVEAAAFSMVESGLRRDVSARFRQRHPNGTLGVPVVQGDVVQIVDLVPEGGARVDVEARGPYVKRVGYIGPDAIGHPAMQGARATTWFFKHSALYTRGEDVQAAGGIRGEALTKRQIAQRVAVPVFGVFAGLVAALVILFRRLRHAASVERADAILARDIDAVGARAR